MKPFSNVDQLPGDVVSLRQALFLATATGLMAGGATLMYSIVGTDGLDAVEWVLLILFVPLFAQISIGFTIAFWGFIKLITGGDRYEIMRTLPNPPAEGLPSSTAIVLPVFNEDPDRTFRGLENMFRSVEATGDGRAFDFFVLSDSNDPNRWIEEETAWFRLCSRCQAFGRIFYRKRRVSLHGKSGNVADFCRRWGRRYKYLLVLDADSVMDGQTIVRLARVMDANPRVGIVQTAPQIVRGTSVFQRFIQFATRMVGPLFSAGSSFWHLGGGNYWGHNAIIRLKPFIEHCVLPELPGRSAADRHILSHDTVEASLMQQAGYQVWFAYREPGSFEEGPPNLTESLKRDRRWCQGNLQHFWFLFAPGTRFTNRLHIFFGLMSYLSAPLLVVFILLSSWDGYWKNQYLILSAQEGGVPWAPLWLLALTAGLLFVPKFLGLLYLLPRAKAHGGIVRTTVSAILETLLSILLAPILLFFYTKFVLLTMMGLRVTWKTQNREQSDVPLGEAIRTYWQPTLAGVLGTAATLIYAPSLTVWLSPLLVGLVLTIPFVLWTSSDGVGRFFRTHGIFAIPEETNTPDILKNLDGPDAAGSSIAGVLQVAVSPEVNALHTALLRRSRVHARHRKEYLDGLRQRVLSEGPNALTRRELTALLWDGDAVADLHREVWRSDDSKLAGVWRNALRRFNETAILLDRRERPVP
ncbi:MAG: glucans biosynthesis glucosyltransferase MdoH [Terrimicrobiaceae bacterium]|nr:glucans biosynthesis glucosyltransferase MdoH [Terrimicrobiaceae bacterium]